MKKIALLMLVFTLFAGTSMYAQKLKNGTYEGSASGYGDVYVNVSVSGREIKDISVYYAGEVSIEQQDGWMSGLINGNAIDNNGFFRDKHGNIFRDRQANPRHADPKQRQEYEENSALLKKEGPRYTSAQDFANAIVKNQSTVIDVMSGATRTCEGIIEAVHNALRSKNGDIVRAWEQEGKQKRLATAQRREKLKEEERQRVAKAEAEKKRQEEESKQKVEDDRQKHIAEALVQEPVTPDASEFKYDIASDGGVKIIKYLGNAMSIRIPEKLEGLAVTEMEKDAFDKNTLVKIVITTNIKNISFSGFTELREVTIGDSVTEIPNFVQYEREYGEYSGRRTYNHGKELASYSKRGSGCFEDCANLAKVTVGKGITVIPDSCFALCINLTEVIFSNSVKKIGTEAFIGCKKLASVKLPTELKTINSSAFMYSGLTAISIPNSVESIGSEAFMNCVNLKSVELPTSISAIAEGVFANTDITSLVIPDSITRIGSYAFYGCKSLSSVTLPKNLTEIGAAFVKCSSLSEIIIPANVKKITFFEGQKNYNSRYVYLYYGGKGDIFGNILNVNNPKDSNYYGYEAFVGCTSFSLTLKSKLRELGYRGDF